MDFSIASILLLDGVTNGAIYALLGLATVLVFTVTRIIFIPQGEFVAYGALTLAMLQTGKTPGTVWLLLILAAVAAVMEGVALNARWLFDSYEKFCKRRIDSVRILGGGAQSDLWCSMYAGMLDRPVEKVAKPRDAQLVGAALWALVSLGEMTLPEAASRVRVERIFAPADCDRETYQQAYAEYRGLYKRLKGLRGPASS